jgi:hypothetical protein
MNIPLVILSKLPLRSEGIRAIRAMRRAFV